MKERAHKRGTRSRREHTAHREREKLRSVKFKFLKEIAARPLSPLNVEDRPINVTGIHLLHAYRIGPKSK